MQYICFGSSKEKENKDSLTENIFFSSQNNIGSGKVIDDTGGYNLVSFAK